MTQLNPWLPSTIKKARAIVEDVDRKTLADRMFVALIEQVHHLATTNAHATHPPRIERFQNEGEVFLSMEWHDQEASWHVCFGVRRKLGEKPRMVLEYSGVFEGAGAHEFYSYSIDNPTDEEIRKALHDYFQAWRTA